MALKSTAVNESIVVPGSSVAAVVQRAQHFLSTVQDLAVTNPSEGVLQLARTVRGVGGRTTELCTVTTVNEPQRLLVTVHGRLPPAALDGLKEAILGRSPEEGSPSVAASFRPHVSRATAAEPATRFVPPSDWFVVDEPAAPAEVPATLSGSGWAAPSGPPVVRAGAPQDAVPVGPSPALPSPGTPPTVAPAPPPLFGGVIQLRFPDGRQVVVGPLMLLGRAPSPRHGEHAAVCLPIPDPSVSKTHLALGREGEAVWVEDRGSTNGTVIVDARGHRIPMEPSMRRVISPPVHLELGDTTIGIESIR